MSIDTDERRGKLVKRILKFEAAAEFFERGHSFLFLGVVTAVSAICVRYGSYVYVDDGRVNEPICAYAGDVRVATN